MALFGSGRDASLIRSINRELINRYIDTEIEFKIAEYIYMDMQSRRYDG